MAVIEAVPGLSIAIRVDGVALKEYPNNDQEEIENTPANKLIKYTEVVSDRAFEIAIHAGKDFKVKSPQVAFATFVDGVFVGGPIHDPGIIISSIAHFEWQDGNGMHFHRALRFAELNIVEDSSAKGEIEEQSKKAAKLGEIKVEVHRVEQRGLSSQSRTPPPTGILTLSEKALKGKELSHVTTFGPAELIPGARDYWSVNFLDGRDNPRATFIFRYRSKDALQKMHVIPRSPSSEPPETEDTPWASTATVSAPGSVEAPSQEALAPIVEENLTVEDMRSIAERHSIADPENLTLGQLKAAVLEHMSVEEMREIVRRLTLRQLKAAALEHMSVEEMREIVRRVRAAEAAKGNFKQEGHVSIRREGNEDSGSARKRRKGPASTIDLTDD